MCRLPCKRSGVRVVVQRMYAKYREQTGRSVYGRLKVQISDGGPD